MNELQIQIDGMTCSACSARIEKALLRMEGMRQAAVSLATSTAGVRWEGGRHSGRADRGPNPYARLRRRDTRARQAAFAYGRSRVLPAPVLDHDGAVAAAPCRDGGSCIRHARLGGPRRASERAPASAYAAGIGIGPAELCRLSFFTGALITR
ncbi:heavy-metal-associated domain-containing protein [Cohnella rhizosphaerae]|uniref:Heavy-metal-associated domain-containing protein n=1 Tax=Cohnella rhizosphaerae TaxID=1457232 RepID=A0A9X4QV81_9BACL|nr:heavy metal-associated domain-containing protein [Cohnella rhizosphaerae]MDG0811257.1 heavy-metal-associated domain-containing protein [Cohnella rhizosphaerae]